jgi:hypothetical protein
VNNHHQLSHYGDFLSVLYAQLQVVSDLVERTQQLAADAGQIDDQQNLSQLGCHLAAALDFVEAVRP